MDADAPGAGDEPDDRVALDGIAAGGDARQEVADAEDGYAGGRAVQTGGALDWGHPRGGLSFLDAMLCETGGEGGIAQLAGSQRGQQVFHGFVPAELQDFPVREFDAHAVEFAAQQVFAAGDVCAAGLPVEPGADLLAGAVGGDVTAGGVEPVGRRTATGLAGDDLYGVAVLQRSVQGHQPSIDLGARDAVAQVGVNLVGEVNGGSAGGEFHDVALGGVHEDLVVEQVFPHRLEEFVGVRGFALPLQELPQPGHALLELTAGCGTGALLVTPVGGDAVLGHLVHVAGLDLHLQGMTAIAVNGGVQGLVHVLLGGGDVIVELAGYGVPHTVGHAQGGVAVGDIIDDYAQGVEVMNVAQFLAVGFVLLHLLVDGIDTLGPAVHLGAELVGGEFVAEPVGDLGDIGLALGTSGGQHTGYFPVSGLVQVSEGKVVKLPLEFPDAQAVRQWGIYVQRFLRDAPSLLFGQRVQRAHVVQPVCQFNEDHANVFGHGHQHLAEAFGIEVFRYDDAGPIGTGRAIIHALQLGDAVHQAGYVGAEAGVQLFNIHPAVLQHVVQQSRLDGVGVEIEVGKDGGGGQRMDDIWVSRETLLTIVAQGGKVIGRPNCVNLGGFLHVLGYASDKISGVAGDFDHRRPPPTARPLYSGRDTGTRRCIPTYAGDDTDTPAGCPALAVNLLTGWRFLLLDGLVLWGLMTGGRNGRVSPFSGDRQNQDFQDFGINGIGGRPGGGYREFGEVIDRWAYDLYGPTDKEVGAMVDV